MQYAPGSEATFYASFTDENLQPKTPDDLYVDLYNANDVKIIENGVPVEDTVGNYHFITMLPEDMPYGLSKIEWQAVVAGVNAFGVEEFDVVAGGVIINPSGQSWHGPLRSRLGESIPIGGSDADTMFLTVEIAEILALHSFDLNRATLEGWQRKAGHLQHLIDFSESGTDRNLSRKFIQAKQMVDHWSRLLAGALEARQAALMGRVPGKVISLRDDFPSAPILTGFSGMYERMYLTHRLIIPALV